MHLSSTIFNSHTFLELFGLYQELKFSNDQVGVFSSICYVYCCGGCVSTRVCASSRNSWKIMNCKNKNKNKNSVFTCIKRMVKKMGQQRRAQQQVWEKFLRTYKSCEIANMKRRRRTDTGGRWRENSYLYNIKNLKGKVGATCINNGWWYGTGGQWRKIRLNPYCLRNSSF